MHNFVVMFKELFTVNLLHKLAIAKTVVLTIANLIDKKPKTLERKVMKFKATELTTYKNGQPETTITTIEYSLK